jgi:three-Cys-motif partner protein
MIQPDSELLQPDGFPSGKVLEVGDWSIEKHQLLRRYVGASWAARRKWPKRGFIDLFCGPGRTRIKGSDIETDGGAVVAWRQTKLNSVEFSDVIIGDVDQDSLVSCEKRLLALNAPVTALLGPAEQTVDEAIKRLPPNGLHLAYLDPFNMEHLPFSIIERLAKVRKIDIVVHFSVMDLQREIELDFLRDESRFEAFAPGWKQHVDVTGLTKQQARNAFVKYWLGLVESLGFQYSKEMPLMTNSNNGPLYRMMFLMRDQLPGRLWGDVARGLRKTPDLFGE